MNWYKQEISRFFIRLNIYLPMTQQSHFRYLCCAVLGHSVVSDSLQRLGTVACQAPLYLGILQARILEWVIIPSSRGSSQPRDQTHVFHIPGRFFTYLRHQGSPWILEWEACAFFRESSWPRNRTRVSCIAGRCFTSWATREAPSRYLHEKCICSQKDLYKNIYRRFIQNGPDWKKSSTGEWIDKL